MIVIWRLTEPKDTLLRTVTNITDRFINTIITAIKGITNITISINHPTMVFLSEHRSSNRDGPSPSRQKTGGKLNKSVRRYIIPKQSGSRFGVQCSKVGTDGYCSQYHSKFGYYLIFGYCNLFVIWCL